MRRVRKELIVAAAAVAALALESGVTKADTSLFTTQSDFTVGPNEADGQNNVGNAGWEPSNNNISANTFTGTLVSGASGDTDGSTVNGVGNFIGGTYQGGQTSAAGAMTVQNLAGGATTGTSSNWCPFNSENEAYSTITGGVTTYTTNTAFFNALGITSAQEFGSENSNTPHGTIAVDFTEPVSPTHVGTFFETQFILTTTMMGITNWGWSMRSNRPKAALSRCKPGTRFKPAPTAIQCTKTGLCLMALRMTAVVPRLVTPIFRSLC